MRFLANRNISPKTIAVLRQQGWDIVCVSELLPVNASDQEIMELARQENRAVITQDLDFSALLALGGYARPSLVTLRLAISNPEIVTRRLVQVLPNMEGVLQKKGGRGNHRGRWPYVFANCLLAGDSRAGVSFCRAVWGPRPSARLSPINPSNSANPTTHHLLPTTHHQFRMFDVEPCTSSVELRSPPPILSLHPPHAVPATLLGSNEVFRWLSPCV